MASSITTTTVNGTTRITGLSSGIDVDSIVAQLVTAEKAKKLNKLQQKEQLATWRQTAYQSVIADIKAFADKYFSLTSATSLLSTKNYNKYTVTSSSSAVAATYTSAAGAGSHAVSVSQLATKATLASSGLSRDVAGGRAASYGDLSGKSAVLTVDGTDYTVDLSSVTDLASLQSALDDAVGDGKLTAGTDTSGCLTITAADSGVNAISISAPASGASGLSDLGFAADGAVTANRIDTTAVTLAGLQEYLGFEFNADGQAVFAINGTTFTFDQDTTIAEMIDEINAGAFGATMAYNATTGELVLTAGKTGAGNLLKVSDSGGTFASAVLTAATAGKDAKLIVDGVSLTRSSNTVTVDGVTYTLNAVTAASEDATVSLTLDTDGIYDLISDFAADYNSLIATITSLLKEDYDADYPPLTDDQKAEMSDEEIEKWEAKAKTGILKNDSLLTGFLRELRSAVVDSIAGVSTSIFDLGIDTGDYSKNGQLEIDADALKEAIASDPAAVMNLFTKQSSTYSGLSTVRTLSAGALSTRYGEEGIAYRFYDIIAEYTATTKDSKGLRGKLVEKAGLADSSIAADNTLSDLIAKYQTEIAAEEDRLDAYEERLYNKYTTLETYISNMNTQLAALSAYLDDSSS